MFDAEQVTRTTQRYESRTPERAGAEAKIESGAILQADTPHRVRLRLMRKGIAPAQAEALLSDEAVSFGQVEAAAAIVPPPAVNALERIIGTVDLINASFLTNGARASRSVCRIVIGDPGGRDGLVIGFGTGVMVSPRLLLTNNHVLESPALAAASQAEFGYEEDGDGQIQPSVQFALAPDTLFLTDPELDYTLVAVDPTARDGTALSDFGWVPLIAQEGKIIKGELVNIIQHPNGEPKRVALRENQVVDLLENFMHYKTDTAPGSSGAPVFNDEWEMVALHHSGVPARDPAGNILAIDGSLWREEIGEHRVKWVANEGARVSRLVARLRAQIDQQGGSDAQRRLLDEALAGIASPEIDRPEGDRPSMGIVTRTSPPAPAAGDSPPATGIAAVAADGTVTWTIPIQFSVRLGMPAGTLPSVPDRPPRTETPPVVTTRPAPTAAPSARLQSALAELERARALPYYDARADKTARTNYYRGLSRRRSGRAFFTALSELVTRTHHTVLPYEPAQHVYPWVDLRPNAKLRSIYTGDEYEPEEIIRADIEVRETLDARLRERFGSESLIPQETLDLLEAQLPYNCEHVVPQSWFGERQPMRGDLHHLFTCESTCNSFRGRKSYFEFTDFEEVIRDGCGKRVENRFEPNHGKGEVARATFYFLLRYPGQINRRADEYEEDRLAMLLEWHRQEPVSEYERHRNAAAFAKQGNRNPLIDFPDWADRIDFTLGLGNP